MRPIGLIGTAVLMLVGLLVSTGWAQEYTIRVATTAEEGSLIYESGLYMAELVSERSSGRMAIEVFGSSQLASQDEMPALVAEGALDMAIGSTETMSYVPALGIFDLPYLFDDRAHITRFLDGPGWEYLADHVAAHGMILLGVAENGFRHMTNNARAIQTPADLVGMVIRTPGSAARVEMFEAWGATAFQAPFGELYEVLLRGTVDGQENPLAQIVSARLYEVQQYLSFTRHVYTPTFFVVSQTLWDSLPTWARDVLREAAGEAGEYSRSRGAEVDEEFSKFVEFQGMHINYDVDMAAFREAVTHMYDQYEGGFGPEALQWVEESRQ